MENEILLETFLLKTATADGYTVIIGGICPYGKKDEAVQLYLQISNVKLGQTKDEFLIDFILASAVTRLSPAWASVVGASIYIEGINNRTGGIIGNPFIEHSSADSEIEEIMRGIYMISFPGGPGLAFKGTYSDTVLFSSIILDDKIDQNIKIKAILKMLDYKTNLYILVADGCGMNYGGIFISDNYGKKHELFFSDNS